MRPVRPEDDDLSDTEREESTLSRTTTVLSSIIPSLSADIPRLLPSSAIFSTPSAASSVSNLGIPSATTRRIGRRSASERPAALDSDEGLSSTVDSEWTSVMGDRVKRRRHSFDVLHRAEEPFELLSRYTCHTSELMDDLTA